MVVIAFVDVLVATTKGGFNENISTAYSYYIAVGYSALSSIPKKGGCSQRKETSYDIGDKLEKLYTDVSTWQGRGTLGRPRSAASSRSQFSL